LIYEEKIQQLKNDVLTKEWEEAREASDDLVESGSSLSSDQKEGIFSFFISLLGDESYDKRCIAAYALKNIGRKEAVAPLFNTIFTRERTNYNGTFVYALTGLDCSEHLKDVFKILFYQGFEARIHAREILRDQEFEFTRQDLLDIKATWESLKINPEKGEYEKDTMVMIDKAVNRYISYLDEQN
jgi:hypothetical protein